jgi:hypothetical protein
MGTWTTLDIFAFFADAVILREQGYIAGKKHCITSGKICPGYALNVGVWLGCYRSSPIETTGSKVVDINKYRWEKLCRGLFELPVAA